MCVTVLCQYYSIIPLSESWHCPLKTHWRGFLVKIASSGWSPAPVPIIKSQNDFISEALPRNIWAIMWILTPPDNQLLPHNDQIHCLIEHLNVWCVIKKTCGSWERVIFKTFDFRSLSSRRLIRSRTNMIAHYNYWVINNISMFWNVIKMC